MSLTVSSKTTGKTNTTKITTSIVSSNAMVTVSKKKLQEVVSAYKTTILLIYLILIDHTQLTNVFIFHRFLI